MGIEKCEKCDGFLCLCKDCGHKYCTNYGCGWDGCCTCPQCKGTNVVTLNGMN